MALLLTGRRFASSPLLLFMLPGAVIGLLGKS
jgi:hypothetical protein